MAKVNLEQLEKNLNKLNYPVSKKDLIKCAEEKGTDEELLRALKKLPSNEYETLADVTKAINKSQ